MRWTGLTVCVVASGPSLTREDCVYAREHADRVIAVNESWRMVPEADVLYAADWDWWFHRSPGNRFNGERWTQHSHRRNDVPGLSVIESRGGNGVAPPGSDFIYTGSNSGFQAMGLAVVWGARRVVFLGLDLSTTGGASHWHGDHVQPLRNNPLTLAHFVRAFKHAAPLLADLGVDVVNASRVTALEAFPRMTIQEALP